MSLQKDPYRRHLNCKITKSLFSFTFSEITTLNFQEMFLAIFKKFCQNKNKIYDKRTIKIVLFLFMFLIKLLFFFKIPSDRIF